MNRCFIYILLCSILTGAVLASTSCGAEERWDRFFDRNTIFSIAFQGDEPWCLTTGGMVRWAGKAMIPAPFDTPFSSTVIATGADGRLWAAAGSDLYMHDKGTWKQLDFGATENATITALACGVNGTVAVGTKNGVCIYDGVVWRAFTAEDGLPYLHVTSVAVGVNGSVYVGTVSEPRWKPVIQTRDKGVDTSSSAGTVKTAKPAGDPSYTAALSVYNGSSWELLKEFPSSDTSHGAYVVVTDSYRLFVWQPNPYSNLATGLHYFDGVGWGMLRDDDGLPSNSIRTVFAEPGYLGDVWIATAAGLCRYSDGKITESYTMEDGLSHILVNTLVYSPEGVVWAGTEHGLCSFDGSDWTPYLVPGIAGSYVRQIIEAPDGVMWFGSEGGISQYDAGHWTTWTSREGLADDYVIDLRIDSRGRVWAMTSSGISLYEGVAWRTFPANAGYDQHFVLDRYDRYWAATSSGLFVYDENGGHQRGTKRISQLFNDPDGGIWAFVEDKEMYHEVGDWSEAITMPKTYSDWIGHASCDAEGNVWVVKWNEILRWDGIEWASWKWEEDDIPYGASSLVHAPGGDIWCVGEKYAYARFRNDSWSSFDPEDGAPRKITGVTFDTNGTAWCNVEGGGTAIYDGDNWTVYADINGTFHPDNEDRMWVMGPGRISVFDNGEWTSYADYPSGKPWGWGGLVFDSHGDLWFSVLNNGVVRFSPTGTEVEEPAAPRPSEITVRAFPNPFNAAVTLQFTIPCDGMVVVDVYSITGQKARTYAKRFMPAGMHTVRWDGMDDDGRAVSSGLYLTRIRSGGMTASARMMLIR